MNWTDITPADAIDLDLSKRPDIGAPRNELGERCPWPWDPQQLVGAPLGQYHCPYCGAMCVAGVPHPDYGAPEQNEWADDAPDLDCPRCGEPLNAEEGETPGAICRTCRAA